MNILNTGLLYASTVADAAEGTVAQAVQAYPFVALGIITLLGGIIVWFVLRTIKQIDGSQARTVQIQDKLFDKLDNLCEDFYTLKGEHKAMGCIQGGYGRRKEDQENGR